MMIHNKRIFTFLFVITFPFLQSSRLLSFAGHAASNIGRGMGVSRDAMCPVIMINPAGDSRDPGRRLVEGYERGVSLALAEYLQKQLRERYALQVILTRQAGERVLDMQNASFANRMKVDFFLSLHVCYHENPKPRATLYHLLYHPLIDPVARAFDPVAFILVHQAHFMNFYKSYSSGRSIVQFLEQPTYEKQLSCRGIFGIPFGPLCGILAPAVAIDLEISYEDQWRSCADALVDSLQFLVQPSA